MSETVIINPEGSTFDEFHSRHRDSKDGKRLPWMPDFHRAKEGIVVYRKAQLKWRVLELAKQTSWGNKNRDYAADANGNPLTQREFANILGVPFQRVSEAIDELVEDGFLRREGRIIFVVDDPAAERATGTERRTKGKRKSPPFRILGEERAKFYASWKERDPEQFKHYQKVGEEIEEKFREQRELFEAAWRIYKEEQEQESGTGRTTDSADPERGGENVRNGAEESSGAVRTEDEPILNGFTSSYQKLASSITQAVENSGLKIPAAGTLDNRSLGNAATRLARAPAEQHSQVLERFEWDCGRMAKRKNNKPRSWGIIVTLMEDAVKYIRKNPAQASQPETRTAQPEQTPEQAREEKLESIRLSCELFEEASPQNVNIPYWLGVFESALRDPEVTGELRERVDRCLKRKPAASESSAQKQKAGQA